MRELPILMNGAMVRAVLEGRKTVTRRLVKRQPFVHHWQMFPEYTGQWREGAGLWRFEHRIPHNPRPDFEEWLRPPCQIGERLYVRETHFDGRNLNEGRVLFQADGDMSRFGWTPSLHMPKALARIWLEVTAVRVERVRDITAEQAIAEGMQSNLREHDAVESLRNDFAQLWNGLAKPGARWDDNPWVWVVDFRRVEHVPGQITTNYRGYPMEAAKP